MQRPYHLLLVAFRYLLPDDILQRRYLCTCPVALVAAYLPSRLPSFCWRQRRRRPLLYRCRGERPYNVDLPSPFAADRHYLSWRHNYLRRCYLPFLPPTFPLLLPICLWPLTPPYIVSFDFLTFLRRWRHLDVVRRFHARAHVDLVDVISLPPHARCRYAAELSPLTTCNNLHRLFMPLFWMMMVRVVAWRPVR